MTINRGDVPYLNGGLFEEMELDHTATVPNKVLELVVDGEDGLFYRFKQSTSGGVPRFET